MVYKSLIESRLKYCIAVWGNCGATLKHKVQRLQDRALGMLSTYRGNRNHDDCLRVQQLIDQEIAVALFKSLNGNRPNYLKQMFVPLLEVHKDNTRNHSTGLFPFHTNMSSGQKSFTFAGYRVWNSLPKNVWTSQTIGYFKLKLKKNICKRNNLQRSFYDVLHSPLGEWAACMKRHHG